MFPTWTAVDVANFGNILIAMFAFFVGAAIYAFRPGSKKVHEDIANIPFRHDDKPARAPLPDVQDAHLTEARQ